jgi:hypothetical protein
MTERNDGNLGQELELSSYLIDILKYNKLYAKSSSHTFSVASDYVNKVLEIRYFLLLFSLFLFTYSCSYSSGFDWGVFENNSFVKLQVECHLQRKIQQVKAQLDSGFEEMVRIVRLT